MLGAIAGDVIGSVYEHQALKTKDVRLFWPDSRFTDDTVLTLAVAEAIMTSGDYAESLRRFGRAFPNAGYGESFYKWLFSSMGPYSSYGNGAAMRVSPVGLAFDTEREVLAEAKRAAEVTHNHPEGVKGAQATALAVFMARHGLDKQTIKAEIAARFEYDLNRTLDDIRPEYAFDVTCQGSVPESVIAFLESDSVEDAIRNAISLGGDADTMACIAGAIAYAYHREISQEIETEVVKRLTPEMRNIVDQFNSRFPL